MENNDIAISQFADTCNIPRPTMSQILNGRNKKISDELITKIHLAYPNLSVLWLMFGEGDMETNANTRISEASNIANQPPKSAQQPDLQQSLSFTGLQKESPGIPPEKSNQGSRYTEPRQNSTFAAHSHPSSSSPEVFSEKPAAAPGSTQLSGRNSIGELIDFAGGTTFTPASTDKTSKAERFPNQKLNDSANIQPRQDNNTNVQISDSSAPTSKDDKSSCIPIHPNPHKQITNIVVFYSDNSFQSFYPH